MPSCATWDPDLGLTIVQTDDAMPLLKHALVYKPSALVYNSLLIVCQHLQLCRGNEKPCRKILLQRLAESQGDQEYVAAVLQADGKKTKQGQTSEDNRSVLLDCLFDNLDLDERMEYRDLKKKNDQSAKFKKQQKWQAWLNQKTEEAKAGRLIFGICWGHHFFLDLFPFVVIISILGCPAGEKGKSRSEKMAKLAKAKAKPKPKGKPKGQSKRKSVKRKAPEPPEDDEDGDDEDDNDNDGPNDGKVDCQPDPPAHFAADEGEDQNLEEEAELPDQTDAAMEEVCKDLEVDIPSVEPEPGPLEVDIPSVEPELGPFEVDIPSVEPEPGPSEVDILSVPEPGPVIAPEEPMLEAPPTPKEAAPESEAPPVPELAVPVELPSTAARCKAQGEPPVFPTENDLRVEVMGDIT